MDNLEELEDYFDEGGNVLEQLEDYLDELDIKYFLADKLEGSDYSGYICVYVDSDDFAVEILDALGFKKVEHDFYYTPSSEFHKINPAVIEELRLQYSHRYNLENRENELIKRITKLANIWRVISEKYHEINTYFFRQYRMDYFKPTTEIIDRAFKLPILLAKDESTFRDFCFYLYQVGYECVFPETRKKIAEILVERHPDLHSHKEASKFFKEKLLQKDPFLEDIQKLRHYYIHVKGSKRKESREKHEVEFNRCCARRGIKKLSNDLEYFQFQSKLLKDFRNYLNKIETIIKTKL